MPSQGQSSNPGRVDNNRQGPNHWFHSNPMLESDLSNRLSPQMNIPVPVNLTLFPRHVEHHQQQEFVEPLNLTTDTFRAVNTQQRPPMDLSFRQGEREEQRSACLPLITHQLQSVSVDEISQMQLISQIHDTNYKSISFGEELIKEMVMSSVFKVPLSPSATMTAYRLMIQRVTRVAQGFDPFINLPHRIQRLLLKQNADLIVSLRGAVFFEKHKCGLDQILISMGVDDLVGAMAIVSTAMKTMSLQRIDYLTFNSLQKVESNQSERRYNQLLEHVGITVSFDTDLVKMLSNILLFSYNEGDKDSEGWREVQLVHRQMVGMMQRYISAKYPKQISASLFSEVLQCISDLQELTWIKKQRQLAVSKGSSFSNLNSLMSPDY